MTLDSNFTNGVIAVKEKQLLGEKLLRFPEMRAGEVLRALSESGFGGGESDPDAIYAYEGRVLDEFIRTYAPGEAERAYFLAPRDFHNLKALYKAERLGVPADPMLAPEGLRSLEELKRLLQERSAPVPDIPEDATGVEIGAAFDRAEFSYLLRACTLRPVLRRLLCFRIDMTNVLTLLRAGSAEEAEKLLLGGGRLKKKDLSRILSEDPEVRKHALDRTPYADFYADCLRARDKLFTDAERRRESFEEKYFYEHRYVLQGKEPFLYYVLRRRAEIANVRMILVCLNAGVDAREIKKRLVGVE